MATVTVLTSDRIIEFENLDIVGGVVDETGDLILTKRSGEEVNLGNVKLHSQLFGLDGDDHPQYALADGSRGAFATVAQGATADNARPMTQAVIEFTGSDPNAQLEVINVTADGTVSDSWVNRLEFFFQDDGEPVKHHTTFFNEFGELRGSPARNNTVAARWFTKEFPDVPTGTRSPTVPIIEVMDDRTNRKTVWGIVADGTTVVDGLRMAYVLVLGPADSVPANTPPGTVIVRTT